MRDRPFIVHPILFAIFPVLSLFSVNLNELGLIDVLLPLIGVVGFGILIWLIIGLALKNFKKAAFITSLGLVIFFSYGHIFLLVAGFDIFGIEITNTLVIPFFILFVIGTIFFLKTKNKLDNPTKIANGIGITLVVIVMINVSTFYFIDSTLEEEILYVDNISQISNFSNSPDVYYIIFDGYPRSDQLAKHFGYSNQDMVRFLEDNRFFIAHNSHANYPITPLSLASSLNMEYRDYLQKEIGIDSKNLHPLKDLLDNNKVMQKFKDKGYRVISFDSGWRLDRLLSIADETLCREDQNINSEFLIMLLRTSMLNPVYVKIFDGDYRENISCVLAELPEVSERYEEPIFVYAHVYLPHGPFVFGPNGEEVVPESMSQTEVTPSTKNDFLNQVKFSDKKIQEIVKKILAKSKTPPIIIIQSDHGSALNLDMVNPDSAGLHQRMSILNAYHLPNGGDSLLYDNITPVNSFRIVLNYYFNETNPLLEDKIFFSSYAGPYNHTEISDIFD